MFKKAKRLIATILTVAITASFSSPLYALTSSFSDIRDDETALYADTLRLMGVVSGTGSNQFSPDKVLTRAEFCSMVLNYMGIGNQISQHATRTIFSDVPASHWARGAVNLAASTSLGTDDKSGRLISGMGNGKFAPDENITYAQAITILLRVLGYTDSDTGAVWPAGYLNLAASLKMTDGITLTAGAPLTRGQAAQLFVRALSAQAKDGGAYYDTRSAADEGKAIKDVIVLSTNATADDQSDGALRTSAGTYKPNVTNFNPTALQGRRGVLMLDGDNKVITFVPDNSVSTTIILEGNAQSAYLKGTNGTRYSISADTPTFSGSGASDDKKNTYEKLWPDLTSGMQVTLFSDNGKVVGIYYGSSSATEDAVIAGEKSKVADFHRLTDGITSFTIEKNRQQIKLSDIQPNDVVTYNTMTNTLVVSDLRLSCIYENAYPNTKNPTQITILGHSFEVLESAWKNSDNVKIGDPVILLLTADGKIAALKAPINSLNNSTVYGIASGSSVSVNLPAGGTIELKSKESFADNIQNKLVTVRSFKVGVISATQMTKINTVTADFDLTKMMVGDYTVAAGVRVFEQVNNGAVVQLSLSRLRMDLIEAKDILIAHKNSSGHVDIIVLNALTGDGYTYGRLEEVYSFSPSDTDYKEDGIWYNEKGERLPMGTRCVTVQNSGKRDVPTISNLQAGPDFKTGDFGGAVAANSSKISSLVLLTKIEGAERGDFFTSEGIDYVTVKGTTYEISDMVECYNSETENWFDSEDPLTEIRAFSESLTIHIDPIAGKVRVISTN